MPTLPQYDARRNIDAGQPAPIMNEAEAIFAPQREVINTLSDISAKWSQANDVMQYTKAKNNYEIAIAGIEAQAAADPNFNNSDKYFQAIEEAKNTSLQGISNNQVKQKAFLEFDFGSKISQIKIQANFNKKKIEDAKFNAGQLVERLEIKRLSASPNEQFVIDDQINNTLNALVATGVYSKKEVKELKYNSVNKAAESVIYADPELGKEQIKKGYFDELTNKDKSDLMAKADTLFKKQEELATWQMKQNNIKGSFQLSSDLANGTLTTEKIRTMQQEGMIDPETAAIFDGVALKKAYDIPDTTSVGEPDYFIRLLEDANGDKPQIEKILKDAAKSYGNNKMGNLQYLYFIQSAQDIFDRQNKGLKGPSNIVEHGINALKSLSSFIKKIGINTSEKQDISKEKDIYDSFLEKVLNGKDPYDAKEDVVIEEQDKLYPQYKGWQKDQIKTVPGLGSIKIIDKDEDGMPIVEIMNGK